MNAITDNTLSIADYNGATEQSRIRWPWNRCSGAGRSTQKRIQEWGKGIDKSLGCLNDVISYAMDNKLVYQKAIFYFSLEAKTKSLKGCPYSNWLLVPGYNTSQQLISTARFVKVNSCRSQENRVQNVTNTGTVLNWRPYEGSRALSKYEADADFGVKYDYNTPADPFIMSIHFHIMSGF